MDQNIKYAIYFLLGIILFYLLFNEKGVEGFDTSNVGFIYVKVDAGAYERFDKLDSADAADAAEITTIETQIGTPSGLQVPSNTILTGNGNIYYKSARGYLFIQKTLETGSCTACTAAQVTAAAGTVGACRTEGGGDCVSSTTREACIGTDCIFTATGVITTPAADDVGTCIACTEEEVDTAAAARTTDTCTEVGSSCTGTTLTDCGENCVYTPTVEYYLIKKNATAITSIHKIISSDLDGLTGTTPSSVVIPVSGITVYTPGSDSSQGSYVATTTTTITIDTFPRCSTPTNASGQGYILNDPKVLKMDGFNVSGTCASNYTGTLAATVCSADNASYTLSGCAITNSINYTCNHGVASDGHPRTATSSCKSCNAGYTKSGITCVQNASCSTFTGTCPEGKEKNEDNNCSGTCTSEVCCEDESDAMMIGLGVGGLILFLIMLGGVALVVMGNKPVRPSTNTISP